MAIPKIPWWSIIIVILLAAGVTLLFVLEGTPDHSPLTRPSGNRRPPSSNPGIINVTNQCTFGVITLDYNASLGNQNSDYSNLNCSQLYDSLNISNPNAFANVSFCLDHNPWIGLTTGYDGECLFPCTSGLGLATNFSEDNPIMAFFNRSEDVSLPVILNFTNGSTIVNFLNHYTMMDPENADAPDPTVPLTVNRTFWNQPNGTVINDPVYYINGGELTAQLFAFYTNVMLNAFFIKNEFMIDTPLYPMSNPNTTITQECFGVETVTNMTLYTVMNVLVRFLSWDGNTTAIIDFYCQEMPAYCRDMFIGFDVPETHDDLRLAFYTQWVKTLADYNNAFPHCIDKKTLHCWILVPWTDFPL